MITKRPLVALGFVLPAVAVYALLVLYPLGSGLWLSLTDSRGGPRADFVGLDQYARLLGDREVMRAIGTTLIYAVVVVFFQNLFGLLLARALYLRPRIRKVVSVLILMPTLVAPVMASFIFSSLYAPDGTLNQVLRSLGLDALTRIWLGSPDTALWAVALVNIWMFAGYSAAIFLAGYLALPADVLEAADLDGASGFRRFRTIEWPLLAPSLTVNVTLSLIGSLKVFEFPFVLTNGGPAGSTTTLTLLIYRKVFGGAGEFAYGITIAVLLLVIVLVLSNVATSVLRMREKRI
ncbi:Lactose transport system permease protein LacF [Microbacterium oxydans]|uniref:Lactose transport system permease protein LacF n=1 Tax=Microbacterium oxydans TaxID=82380 RepID=A0A0F0L139_9MICO|nr:sugar ABC transporter permease [Microbacterium oxydans]KJL26842.1 Lactose transport system permease protein LacF [Microbacterium oxydans]